MPIDSPNLTTGEGDYNAQSYYFGSLRCHNAFKQDAESSLAGEAIADAAAYASHSGAGSEPPIGGIAPAAKTPLATGEGLGEGHNAGAPRWSLGRRSNELPQDSVSCR